MKYNVPRKYLEDLERMLSHEKIDGVNIVETDHSTLKNILGKNAKELNLGANDRIGSRNDIYLNEDMTLPAKYAVAAHEIAHNYTSYGDEYGTDVLAIKGLMNLSEDSAKPEDLKVKAKYVLKSLTEINELGD